ncbi:protein DETOXIFICATION 16-like isoform X2 [Rhododendron vialii]|uniref:protein DETOXIFICATION 16-like isoform X2 n=1 Tax=Rhododendron vialii TaxID=182163 RepID=UPI00265FA337|nr:protein DETOXIFICATION 16-like isoform X2 [Rhododendron vialii]
MDGGKKSSLEARLIITPNHERRDHEEEEEEGGWFIVREEILEEGKKQVVLAGPLIAVSLLQYCLQVISIMFVGHLGELPLSSASLATSFASVSGFSVLTQSVVVPMVMIYGFTALLHVPVCWVLVFGLGMGSRGAAVANGVSNWVNVVLLWAYVTLSPDCAKTWTGFSREGLDDVVGFLKLAVPSAFMICLEYWSFEMVVLLSGLLPNPQLETSVLSVSLNTCWMVYMISVGLGGAISTRVSNEMGAGRPQGARLALCVMVVVAVVEGAVVGTGTILVRHLWGKLYCNEEEVISYVAKMMPLLALSDFLDGFQCVLSGAARGCGWQNLCAFINLGAYYVVAIPSAVLFAFVLHIGGMGLWMGIICGLSVQVIALVTVNLFTDWELEAS